MKNEKIKVQGKEMTVEKMLGKGKSGYSYLIAGEGQRYVLKEMHNEPCPYYDFEGSKLQSELAAYERLKDLIRVPELVNYNLEEEYLIKEYIDGPTAAQLIAEGALAEKYIKQLFAIFNLLEEEGINIDYFPTNFVIATDKLIYIDYELNDYQEQWDLINWGIYYWANQEGMKEYVETGEVTKLNQDSDSGLPKKKPVAEQVEWWIKEYT